MSIGISDIDVPCGDVLCQTCGQKATQLIEWQDDYGGRWWERFCDACFEKTLAAHKETAQLEREADVAAAARLGIDPNAFCMDCGYRTCRCEFDPLRNGSGNVAFTRRG